MFLTPKRILNLTVNGQVIPTTADHPYFVHGQGWIKASDLRAGDLLLSDDGQCVAIEAITETGTEEVVHNLGEHPVSAETLTQYRNSHPMIGFTAGMLVRTANGPVPVEQLRPGDLILTRFDADQPKQQPQDQDSDSKEGIPLRTVCGVFVHVDPVWRLATFEEPLWELKAGGEVIQSRPDHPFCVIGKGWVPLWQLQPGDPLLTDDGQRLLVEEVIAPPGWPERN